MEGGTSDIVKTEEVYSLNRRYKGTLWIRFLYKVKINPRALQVLGRGEQARKTW
jgi:hypothetical protein